VDLLDLISAKQICVSSVQYCLCFAWFIKRQKKTDGLALAFRCSLVILSKSDMMCCRYFVGCCCSAYLFSKKHSIVAGTDFACEKKKAKVHEYVPTVRDDMYHHDCTHRLVMSYYRKS
jgi:hypothetical protein